MFVIQQTYLLLFNSKLLYITSADSHKNSFIVRYITENAQEIL